MAVRTVTNNGKQVILPFFTRLQETQTLIHFFRLFSSHNIPALFFDCLREHTNTATPLLLEAVLESQYTCTTFWLSERTHQHCYTSSSSGCSRVPKCKPISFCFSTTEINTYTQSSGMHSDLHLQILTYIQGDDLSKGLGVVITH